MSKRMYLKCAGRNTHSQLGVPVSETGNKVECVTIEINVDRIQSISATEYATIIINDHEFYFSGLLDGLKAENFQVIDHDIPDASVACGSKSVYILSRDLKLYQFRAKENKLLLKNIIGIFAGQDRRCSINILGHSQVGTDHILNCTTCCGKNIEIVICSYFTIILTVLGELYIDNEANRTVSFKIVKSLSDVKIKKISGCCNTCAAVSEDGRLFTFGSNSNGQLCDGTTDDDFESFREVEFFAGKRVKDVSCSDHILVLTEDDELYGCGRNDFYQLFKRSDNASSDVVRPILISKNECISNIHAGYSTSYYTVFTKRYENPCKSYFSAQKQLHGSIVHYSGYNTSLSLRPSNYMGKPSPDGQNDIGTNSKPSSFPKATGNSHLPPEKPLLGSNSPKLGENPAPPRCTTNTCILSKIQLPKGSALNSSNIGLKLGSDLSAPTLKPQMKKLDASPEKFKYQGPSLAIITSTEDDKLIFPSPEDSKIVPNNLTGQQLYQYNSQDRIKKCPIPK